MKTKNREQTARHWDKNPWDTDTFVFWSQLPAVQRRLALKESGREDGNWVDYTLETHFAGRLPLDRCLSLGCGRGRVERQWAENDAFVACDAYDISAGSIAEAEEMAAEAGFTNIHYAVADIERIQLSRHRYDAALAVSSAHHFTELEHVFSQVAHCLKPDGLFILHEYIGANRFQFGDRQRQVIEACLELLPMEYRVLHTADAGPTAPAVVRQRDAKWVTKRAIDKLREGDFLSTAGRFWRRWQAARSGSRPIKEAAVPTESSVIAVDPSEAVRSADIMPVLETFFDIVEYRPLGGSILQFLLAEIAGNFQNEEGEQLLQAMFQLEDALIACDDLPNDFALIIARPRLRSPD